MWVDIHSVRFFLFIQQTVREFPSQHLTPIIFHTEHLSLKCCCFVKTALHLHLLYQGIKSVFWAKITFYFSFKNHFSSRRLKVDIIAKRRRKKVGMYTVFFPSYRYNLFLSRNFGNFSKFRNSFWFVNFVTNFFNDGKSLLEII